MMSYLFLGEGKNDELVVPIILERHDSGVLKSEFKTWKSLHGRSLKGFKKKAKLAIKLARLSGVGLVATLDADNQPNRIKLLEDARREDREVLSEEPIPVVVGQANPELEAWLLDDVEAVKTGLGLSANTSVPKPKDVPDVKVALDQLIDQSEYDRPDALEFVAKHVQCDRSRAPSKTGLQQFLDDAKSELPT